MDWVRAQAGGKVDLFEWIRWTVKYDPISEFVWNLAKIMNLCEIWPKYCNAVKFGAENVITKLKIQTTSREDSNNVMINDSATSICIKKIYFLFLWNFWQIIDHGGSEILQFTKLVDVKFTIIYRFSFPLDRVIAKMPSLCFYVRSRLQICSAPGKGRCILCSALGKEQCILCSAHGAET